MGSINRRTTDKAFRGINARPYVKITETKKPKRSGGMVQVVQGWPIKCKALNS
jgi:hypothetical protein